MGVRSSVVVCVTSFLLGLSVLSFFSLPSISLLSQGALFTHWIADSLTLWKSPVTDEHLWTAAIYYSILAKVPPEILYFLSAIVILGAITILWSLRDGEAGNIMFDGGSICASASSTLSFLYLICPHSPIWHHHCYVSAFCAPQFVLNHCLSYTNAY